MHRLLLPTGLLLASPLLAQGLRLDRKVERPLVYLAQQAPEPGGEDVLAALGDRGLRVALGLDRGSAAAGASPGAGLLHSVQGLLARLSHSSDAAEMALVGVVPLSQSRSRPLLVFHSQLRAEGAREMRALLAENALTCKGRRVHEQQIYQLLAGTGGGAETGAVEVALVDRDLIVSNDKPTMGRILDPRTSAAGGFARDPRFQRLRRRLVAPPGSVLVYADWQALEPQLDGLLHGDARWMLAASGMESPEQLMFVARPAPRRPGQKRGIRTTFLLHHSSDSYKFTAGETDPAALKAWRPDGWLDLLRRAPARDLLAGLPTGGIAGLSASLDLDRMLPTHCGQRMRRLQARIFHACRNMGIDIQGQILRRLSPGGGLQFLRVRDDAEAGPEAGPMAGLRLCWSLRAKGRKEARAVFDLLEKCLVREGAVETVGAGPKRHLHWLARHWHGARFAVVQDSLVLAFEPQVFDQMRASVEKQRRAPGLRRRNAALMSRIARLGLSGKQKAAGLFCLDLRDLAGRDTASGKDKDKRRPSVRYDGLLGLHGGYFVLEKDQLRLEVFTELRTQ